MIMKIYNVIIVVAMLLFPIDTFAIDPYTDYYGSEYTQEVFTLSQEVIAAIRSNNSEKLNTIIENINNRLSGMDISERAKLYQKFERTNKRLIRESRDKDQLESNAEKILPTLPSVQLLKIFAKEAEKYNRDLFKAEEKARNKVEILPTDKTIKFYLAINPQKFATGADYTTDDLKPSGELLITQNGIFKAFTDSDGWHRIISYNRKTIAPGWTQVNVEYYLWPYFGQGSNPDIFFIIRDADLK